MKTLTRKAVGKQGETAASTAAFLRGFSHGIGKPLDEATITWRNFSKKLDRGQRLRLENEGYGTGFFCAIAYTTSTT